jgi:hypothetical protein
MLEFYSYKYCYCCSFFFFFFYYYCYYYYYYCYYYYYYYCNYYYYYYCNYYYSHEVRGGHGEERAVRLRGHSLGQIGLSCARLTIIVIISIMFYLWRGSHAGICTIDLRVRIVECPSMASVFQ